MVVALIWLLKDRRKHLSLNLEARRSTPLIYHAIDLDRTFKLLQSKRLISNNTESEKRKTNNSDPNEFDIKFRWDKLINSGGQSDRLPLNKHQYRQ